MSLSDMWWLLGTLLEWCNGHISSQNIFTLLLYAIRTQEVIKLLHVRIVWYLRNYHTLSRQTTCYFCVPVLQIFMYVFTLFEGASPAKSLLSLHHRFIYFSHVTIFFSNSKRIEGKPTLPCSLKQFRSKSALKIYAKKINPLRTRHWNV